MKSIADRKRKTEEVGLPAAILRVVLSILAVSTVAASATLMAQETPPEIVGVRVGVADRYKVGLWTEVEVTLRGGSVPLTGDVAMTVPDGDGVPSRVVTPKNEPCRLAAGRESAVRLLCRFGRVKSTLKVDFRVQDETVASRTFEAASQADASHFLPGVESRNLIVTVGELPVGVEEVGKAAGIDPEHRPVDAHLNDLRRLPTHCYGYEGIDAVILATSQPSVFERCPADSPQIRALEQWVRQGGRLVLCVGEKAEKAFAAQSPLKTFLPGRLEKMASLRQTGSLEGYCNSRASIPQTGSRTALRVPRLTDVRGTIEAHEADLPLVVRAARGFGQILFVAADLDRAPLMKWQDRPLFLARLLDIPVGRSEESAESTAMMHFGYNDLAGQLRSALDAFDGVQSVPFWLVAGIIIVYLLLIGPGDYFSLRKLAARMQWTWLTFPLIVAVTCVGACWLAFRLKGNEVKLNQANIVDVDTVSGAVRGATWCNIFSPRLESFDLSIMPLQIGGGDLQQANVWFAWLGLPGSGLGGMNPRAGDATVWPQPYDFSPTLSTMQGVPIQVWSTKSFCGRWSASTPTFPQAELGDDNQFLVGTVVNTFDFPLEQCILAYGRSVYELGTIAPGEAARIGSMTKRSDLKTLLTGRKIVAISTGDKYQQEATPYDQSSVDLAYILRMMAFYDAAGGRHYTGLWNAYQDFVDLSSLLKTDRAILMASQSADKPANSRAAAVLRDGRPIESSQGKQTTIYRFIFPVKKGGKE